jgi:hypothetical protein
MISQWATSEKAPHTSASRRQEAWSLAVRWPAGPPVTAASSDAPCHLRLRQVLQRCLRQQDMCRLCMLPQLPRWLDTTLVIAKVRTLTLG